MLIETWNENETVDFFHLFFAFISLLIDGAAGLIIVNSSDLEPPGHVVIRFCFTTLNFLYEFLNQAASRQF